MPYLKKEQLFHERRILGRGVMGSIGHKVISTVVPHIARLGSILPVIGSTLASNAHHLKTFLPIAGTALALAPLLKSLAESETGQNIIKKIKGKVGLVENKPMVNKPIVNNDDDNYVYSIYGNKIPKNKQGGRMTSQLLNNKSRDILSRIKKGSGINII
jgi:hypothetical protein